MCKSGLMMWFVAFPVLALACMASGFNLREASVTDCGGADATILFVQGTLSPDPIQYPGTVNLGVEFEVYENLPEGLQIELQLTKLDPDMEVPSKFLCTGEMKLLRSDREGGKNWMEYAQEYILQCLWTLGVLIEETMLIVLAAFSSGLRSEDTSAENNNLVMMVAQ
ncbi:unnamed protein product [Darwinula stevensoni]|uniref:Uncharacterized protein n=1 Tax=Darwinula stevensoni TaxID=69355 RepID=A0A7R9AGD3_9CRUS|nr:unnamed protein product [Darwinula stevensoni]CAG0903315.1 unnamed protein product [Darwinula stevensoni]